MYTGTNIYIFSNYIYINIIWKIKSQLCENLRVLVLGTELETINRFLSAGLFYISSLETCTYV